MRKLFIRYVNGSHIIWLCSTSSNTQVIRKYSPQGGGNGRDFNFLVAGPWHDPVLTAHSHGCGVITNACWAWIILPLCTCPLWPLPPSPTQGNVEDFDFVSAIPHSNHHMVGTASWQNHDNSHPQSVIILHCHGCLCLSNTYNSSMWK